ncbi:MAG: SDR family oxidoreductase [Longimicrobiales bacterium]|nr:SDR family oxidoreductase [Longimicrobiales bacterium]
MPPSNSTPAGSAGASSPFRDDCLEGKVALVTGGGTGIGRGISLTLARHGAKIVLASRDRDHLDPTAEEVRELGSEALVVELDVRDRETVAAAVDRTREEMGAVDILVNNAAGNFLVRAEELSEGGWRAVVDIVLTGTFNLSQAVFPHMKEDGGGSIVNITTTYTDTGAPWMAHSGAAKAGVLNLTRTLATEWGRHGIRVNAVAPGLVEGTEGARRLVESIGLKEEFEKAVPLGRLTRVDDVALAVLFLCSPAADDVTGVEIVVDGGASLGGKFAQIGDMIPKG